jgi:uncharacterized protein YkwD
MKTKPIIALCLLLALSNLQSAVYAASESESAAMYLAERGIFEGDENGDLNLGKSLTRAELAVILTRLEFTAEAPGGLDEWRDWGMAHFSDPENRYNTFTDLPDWALPYIEYCYERGLMKGVGDDRFDPQGKVTPKAACAVILRYCGIPENDWNYDTSVAKAQTLGIAPSDGTNGGELLRGTMAVIIRRGTEYDGAATGAPAAPGGVPAEASVPGERETAPPSEVPAQGETSAMTIDEMKAEIVRLTNEERAKAGLPALEVLPELMDCAQAKADDMVDTGYVQHYSPRYGKSSEMIRSFVPNAGTVAENTTFGLASIPYEAVGFWMDSEGHRENIMNSKITHIGIGIAKWEDGPNAGRYAWVQQFAQLKQ